MIRRGVLVALGVLVTLVVAGTVTAYLVLDAQRTPDVDCATFRFDSKGWKIWQAGAGADPYGPAHRPGSRFTAAQVSAHGLVKCGKLAGSDKRELRALLGVPDGHRFADDSWSYALGPGRGLLGESSGVEESLSVRFDARGRLIVAELRTRHT